MHYNDNITTQRQREKILSNYFSQLIMTYKSKKNMLGYFMFVSL